MIRKLKSLEKMKNKLSLTILLFALYALSVNSQEVMGKWAIGFSASSVLFNEADAPKIGQRYNVQFPRINASRDLFMGLSLDVAVTFNILKNIEGLISNAFDYVSFDAAVRYDFGLNEAVLVPYVGVGASYIEGASTVPNAESAISYNALGGATLWVTKGFGFVGQATYKVVSSDAIAMVSHLQGSLGIVFNLGGFFKDNNCF